MTGKDNELDKLFNESLSRLNKLSSSSVADLSAVSFASEKTDASGVKETVKEEKAASEQTEELSNLVDSVDDSSADNSEKQDAVQYEITDEAVSDSDDTADEIDYDDADEEELDEYEDSEELEEQEPSDDDEFSDEDEFSEDEDFADDEDFVEEYTDVSMRSKLQFNMREERAPKRKRKKKKVKPNNSILVGTVVTVIVIAVSFILSFMAIQVGVEYMGLSKSEESVTFDIPVGTTTDTIADLLYQKGIINNPTLFNVVMKLKKVDSSMIYDGEITLTPNMTYSSIIDAICTSRKVYETVTVTFTEGISLYKAAKLLEEKEVCSAADFLTEFNKNSGFDFENGLTLNEQTLYKMEGFFFPDTYEFYKEDTAENVVSKIKTNFNNKMTDEVMALVEQSGLSLYEVITLASIVQAEADTKENMELVASVFLNRLSFTAEFPHLQSDATYFYVRNTIASAVGGIDKSASYEPLYDTYSCYGLPIGAIGNPGMDAIMAVLKPAETNYCYFVTDSKTGEFYYAETYEEHKINCEKAGY